VGGRRPYARGMSNRTRILVPAAIVLGVVFVGLAVLYAVEPAKSLPLPDWMGHDASSDRHHVKHAIASLLLGLGCFVFAWFESGRTARAA